jgi:BTB/POZ domain
MGTMQKMYAPAEVLAGVPQLLDDLLKLVDDQETADIVFVLGRDEEKIYAHRLILMARCKSFQVCNSGNKSISAYNFMQLSYSLVSYIFCRK